MRGDVEVVGDDAQALVMQQRARDRLGGGADVDDQRAAVRAPGVATGGGDAPLGLALSAWRWP